MSTQRQRILIVASSLLLLGFLFYLILHSVMQWDIEKQFGNGYVLCAHGEIFYVDKKRDDSFFYVIPYGVKKFNFNNNWILAQTSTKKRFCRDTTVFDINAGNDSINNQYWLIDKSLPINTEDSSNYSTLFYDSFSYNVLTSLIGPLSLEEFKIIKKNLKIDIDLSEQKQ